MEQGALGLWNVDAQRWEYLQFKATAPKVSESVSG